MPPRNQSAKKLKRKSVWSDFRNSVSNFFAKVSFRMFSSSYSNPSALDRPDTPRCSPAKIHLMLLGDAHVEKNKFFNMILNRRQDSYDTNAENGEFEEISIKQHKIRVVSVPAGTSTDANLQRSVLIKAASSAPAKVFLLTCCLDDQESFDHINKWYDCIPKGRGNLFIYLLATSSDRDSAISLVQLHTKANELGLPDPLIFDPKADNSAHLRASLEDVMTAEVFSCLEQNRETSDSESYVSSPSEWSGDNHSLAASNTGSKALALTDSSSIASSSTGSAKMPEKINWRRIAGFSLLMTTILGLVASAPFTGGASLIGMIPIIVFLGCAITQKANQPSLSESASSGFPLRCSL